jgi:Protein of unknown function DUF72
MDRQEPDRIRPLLPAEVQHTGRATPLLCLAVSLVEVDSSYYAMPTAQVAQLWAERTPPGFTFNIKAFRLFTGHQTSPAVLPTDVLAALGPVGKKNIYCKNLPRELTDEMWRNIGSE